MTETMIYLDNAATTYPKPESVQQAMESLARRCVGNPGRGGHWAAREASQVLDTARRQLSELFGAADPARIVFTLNGTDSLNVAIKGSLRPGDHVITGSLEHNSVRRPLAALQRDRGIDVTEISCDAAGYYRPQDVKDELRPNTRLVALTHASNVLGTVQPIEAIGRICRAHGALFLVDAAQTAGAWPIDVQDQAIDLLAAPGHKSLYGPMGTGVLYVGPRAAIAAWREGGTGGDSLSPFHPEEMPLALEGGTANIPGIAALSTGVEYVLGQGRERLQQRHTALADELLSQLAELPRLRVLGKTSRGPRLPVISFLHESVAAEDLSAILDESFHIAVRAGLHCAPAVHKRFGTYPEGTVRVSPSPLSPPDALAQLVSALREIDRELGGD